MTGVPAPDPEIQAVLDALIAAGRPSSRTLPLEEGRRNFADLFASLTDRPDVAGVRDDEFAGPGGAIPVRVYTPAGVADDRAGEHFGALAGALGLHAATVMDAAEAALDGERPRLVEV